MKHIKLFLIFTPIDKKYKDAETHYAPPLGLVALKNFLEVTCPNVAVTIIDGSVCYSTEQIISLIEKAKPEYVGQSIQLISYGNALLIADAAKRVGAVSIVGGHHATQMRKEIAVKRESIIDFIVFGDGEQALSRLLSGHDLSSIPNLAYSRDGKYFENAFTNLPLSNLPTTSYYGIDLTPYRRLLSVSTFNRDRESSYLRIFSHKGCGNRGRNTACIFCGRADVGVRFKETSQYWDDIESVVNKDGADYVFDVGDDFLGNPQWLWELVRTKRKIERAYKLGVYARANRVSIETARLLSEINVRDVVIGFEASDPDVMARIGKAGTTVEANLKAAELLFHQNIDVCASFVLGSPGETSASLDSTVSLAAEIVNLSVKIRGVKPREMVANLLEPSPGSPAFRAVVERYSEKYKGVDMLDLNEMQYDYFRTFFNITTALPYEQIREKMRRSADAVHNLVDFSDSQGWLKSELGSESKADKFSTRERISIS